MRAREAVQNSAERPREAGEYEGSEKNREK